MIHKQLWKRFSVATFLGLAVAIPSTIMAEEVNPIIKAAKPIHFPHGGYLAFVVKKDPIVLPISQAVVFDPQTKSLKGMIWTDSYTAQYIKSNPKNSVAFATSNSQSEHLMFSGTLTVDSTQGKKNESPFTITLKRIFQTSNINYKTHQRTRMLYTIDSKGAWQALSR